MKNLKLPSLCALLLLAPSGFSQLAAQTIPFNYTGTSPVSFQMDQYGDLSSTGAYGTGTLSLSGAGTRMVWYPGKAAFRAGSVSGSQWDNTNIGPHSVAFGSDTIASGEGAIAFGHNTTASGPYSTAIGFYSNAVGAHSTAIGQLAYAINDYSIAMGQFSYASGYNSIALGYGTSTGNLSTAMGYSTASGQYSTATGTSTATGDYSTAAGNNARANALGSFAVGTCNVGGGNPTTWVPTDPLFEVGNGTGPSTASRSDALIVYKNGNAAFQGVVTVAPRR